MCVGAREMTDEEIMERIESLEEVLEQRKEKSAFIGVARNTYNIYSSYVEAGFSDDQAFELLKMIIGRAIYNN